MNYTLKLGLIAFVLSGILRVADFQNSTGHFATGFFTGLSIVLMIVGSYRTYRRPH